MDRLVGLLRTRFPVVRDLSDDSFRRLAESARIVELGADDSLLQPGQQCTSATLVAEGAVRVHMASRSGRDLTLYRVQAGGMCALSVLCVQTTQSFPAHADALCPTVGIAVPGPTFRALLGNEPAWRSYAFGSMWNRVDDLITRIDDVTFSGVPARLARWLLDEQRDGVVEVTHERLAAEIGSSREVVSRLLGRWERADLVALARGRITILSPATMSEFCEA